MKQLELNFSIEETDLYTEREKALLKTMPKGALYISNRMAFNAWAVILKNKK